MEAGTTPGPVRHSGSRLFPPAPLTGAVGRGCGDASRALLFCLEFGRNFLAAPPSAPPLIRPAPPDYRVFRSRTPAPRVYRIPKAAKEHAPASPLPAPAIGVVLAATPCRPFSEFQPSPPRGQARPHGYVDWRAPLTKVNWHDTTLRYPGWRIRTDQFSLNIFSAHHRVERDSPPPQ